MNLEECIKDLDPELREKAHACGSEDELRSFLENEAIPIPDEALSAVAGGAGDDSKVGDYCDRCPKCGSTDITTEILSPGLLYYKCNACGHRWPAN